MTNPTSSASSSSRWRGVDLTVAAEQQPCGVQVVEWIGLVYGTIIISFD
jgi:hypothetical protein